MLPSELGGTAGTLSELGNSWRRTMVENKARLLQLDDLLSVEEMEGKMGATAASDQQGKTRASWSWGWR